MDSFVQRSKPALASALSYVDAYRTDRLWANMIEAQRDLFGAHGFGRLDKPGRFHAQWAETYSVQAGAQLGTKSS